MEATDRREEKSQDQKTPGKQGYLQTENRQRDKEKASENSPNSPTVMLSGLYCITSGC